MDDPLEKIFVPRLQIAPKAVTEASFAFAWKCVDFHWISHQIFGSAPLIQMSVLKE
jgi:hypothetical protein